MDSFKIPAPRGAQSGYPALRRVESTPTPFINGKMQKGGVAIEELENLMAPYFKSYGLKRLDFFRERTGPVVVRAARLSHPTVEILPRFAGCCPSFDPA